MSKFKVEFTLKQHTPIIHFQSDQSGATLRATELKPKFDRFLLALKNQNLKPSKGPQGEKYFDYKVKITSENLIIKDFDKFPPLYFARDNKQLSTAKLKIEIIAFDDKLIEIIKTEFPRFLAVTNFGSRSSKGYGSFWDEKIMPTVFMDYAKTYYPKIYKLDAKVNEKNWEKVVGDFYKLVKMGSNHGGYKKAYLWEYFAQNGIRWEKRKIKKEFPDLVVSTSGKLPIDVQNPKDENFRFIRVMLGLAGHYEFKILDKKYPTKPDGKPNFKKDPEKINITCNDDSIKRMRSPIEFKIIGNTVYLLCNDFYKYLYGKSFNFKYGNKDFNIIAPQENEFDLYKFMDYLVQRNIIKVAQ